MTDDTGSLKPLTDFLVGGLVSILIIAVPLGAVAFTNDPILYVRAEVSSLQ